MDERSGQLQNQGRGSMKFEQFVLVFERRKNQMSKRDVAVLIRMQLGAFGDPGPVKNSGSTATEVEGLSGVIPPETYRQIR